MSVYRPSPDAADHRLAHELAAAAGTLLLDLRADPPADLGEAGDRRANRLLMDRLADSRPSDAILSEESRDDPARLRHDRVWIIDPLDGTREFAEPGRTDWAVHVALWADGALIAGAVALPASDQVFSTWQPLVVGHDPNPRVLVVSRTRPPSFAPALARRWNAILRPMGSAGAKTAAVLTGQASAYVHAGGQFEWDSAAPVAVALACGLDVRRLDGSAPRYNQANPALPDIVICRPDSGLWPALSGLAADGSHDEPLHR
ncbi:3'(2'), 5'-bisphosphate nucleotidase [Kibdelosporangium banguiense]|uniref:3'(2'), 5'-bisphosphate nucleotidase n=1 Tax=Kibdelosporangium banguiense TaxID=1365924 RepID=A0ABS4TKP1_9PSEU|nr:3'(2'),5'-bisphosphate nucleotidase CysQ [Kibdelosporangium banguiense]MBP2324991.1 3'(2'), 5'-bisphosphate nucleotidase [Kibdelosporangium banguiense]